MPEMDGFAFAEAVRGNARWGGKPLIALTSRSEAADVERGRLAGFHQHVAKSDHRSLLGVLAHLTGHHTKLEQGAAA